MQPLPRGLAGLVDNFVACSTVALLKITQRMPTLHAPHSAPGLPMNRPRRPLPTLALSALLGAGAVVPAVAQTYRIVQPDGRVTYSDRRPTDAQWRTRELGKPAPTSPLFTPGTDLFEPVTPPPARQADDGFAAPLMANGRPFPPGVADAVLTAVGYQVFVQTMLETCAKETTAGLDRYQAVVRDWRQRNNAVLAKADRITFTYFTGEQRDLLRATSSSRLDAVLAPLKTAAAPDRLRWCELAANIVQHKGVELVGDARLAAVVKFDMN